MPKRGYLTRYLDMVERLGNRLPEPLTLFALLALAVVITSWIAAANGLSVLHPGTGVPVHAQNLVSADAGRRMLHEAVTNFTSFAPLGIVLVTIIGIAVAERSGLVDALLRSTVRSVPRILLPAALVFAGVNSSLAADAGFVILPPLGAIVFAGAGRHPMAGLAAAFAGVAGGFSANVFVTSLDPLLGGLSQEAARLVVPGYVVDATANYYFMLASVFVLTACGTFVTTRIVEPRLGPWKDAVPVPDDVDHPRQRRALRATLTTFLVYIGIVALLTVPEQAPFRAADGSLRPFFDGIVALVTLLFFLCGLVYGIVAGTIRSDRDVVTMMSDGMAAMGSYIVLAFVIAQFVAYFKWSNLGIITAVGGADVLRSLDVGGPILLVCFVVLSALIDLVVGSASAKWAVMAPVFVPMFMLLGFTPEAVQAAYRIGDSIANSVSPLLPYFPLVLVAARRYVPGANVGTIISTMLPYTIVFGIAWTLLLLVWLYAGIPLGPGVRTFLP